MTCINLQGIAIGLVVVLVSAVWFGVNFQLRQLVNVVKGNLNVNVEVSPRAEENENENTNENEKSYEQFVEATGEWNSTTTAAPKGRQTRWL